MSVIPNQQELQAIKDIIEQLLASGLYKQKKGDQYVNLTPAEAFAKVLFGWEIGIGAAQSMSALNIYQGKLSMSSALMTGLMVRGGFDWITKVHNDEECTLLIRNADKEELGEITFTYKQALDAGLPNKNANWKTYRKDMLFARCISAAARRYASAVFGGNSVYTAEELGGEDKVVAQHAHNGNTADAVASQDADSVTNVTSLVQPELANKALIDQLVEVATQLEKDSKKKMQLVIDTINHIAEELGETPPTFDTSSGGAFKKALSELVDADGLTLVIEELKAKLEPAKPAKVSKPDPKA